MEAGRHYYENVRRVVVIFVCIGIVFSILGIICLLYSLVLPLQVRFARKIGHQM